MENETGYLNFLKILYNEEIYLIDEVDAIKEYETLQEKTPIHAEANRVEEPAEPFNFQWPALGSESAKIAFILNENSDEAIPPSIKDRFTKMLENLNAGEVLIANTFGKDKNSTERKIESLAASKVIFMGTEGIFDQLSINRSYQTAKHLQKEFLFTPSFSMVVNDKKEVLNLWEALKKFL